MDQALLDSLQTPSALRLAMGEMTPQELRTAQAAVRYTLAHLARHPSTAPNAAEVVPAPAYRVGVETMKESHQITYWVCLDRPDRALDAAPWDKGRITPFKSTILEHVNHEAEKWARFLGASFEPLVVKEVAPAAAAPSAPKP